MLLFMILAILGIATMVVLGCMHKEKR